MPAPKVISPEHEETIVQMRASGADWTDIAVVIGVARSSVQRFVERHPDVAQRIERQMRLLAKRETQRKAKEASRARKRAGITSGMRPELANPVGQPRPAPAKPYGGGTRIRAISVDTPASAAGFFGSSDWEDSLAGHRVHQPNTPAYREWIETREVDRTDPPVEVRLRDVDGREVDYRCVRSSDVPRFREAGYEVML